MKILGFILSIPLVFGLIFSGIGNWGLALFFAETLRLGESATKFFAFGGAVTIALGYASLIITQKTADTTTKQKRIYNFAIACIMTLGVIGYSLLAYRNTIDKEKQRLNVAAALDSTFKQTQTNNSQLMQTMIDSLQSGYMKAIEQRSPKTATAAREAFSQLANMQMNIGEYTSERYVENVRKVGEERGTLAFIYDISLEYGLWVAIGVLILLSAVWSLGVDISSMFNLGIVIRIFQIDQKKYQETEEETYKYNKIYNKDTDKDDTNIEIDSEEYESLSETDKIEDDTKTTNDTAETELLRELKNNKDMKTKDKVAKYIEETGNSRPTYFRRIKQLNGTLQ